ncbi:hypothetical protein [Methylomagnum sp.]
MPKLIALCLTASFLMACSEGLLREASSPAYADGYRDGCANGSSTASNLTGQRTRDEARYNAEPDYAQGWQNGDRECNGENLETNPNNPMEPIDLDGPT